MKKTLLRLMPGLAIVSIYMAVFWSPFYEMLPPDFQLFMAKLFLPVLGVVFAHWVGIALLPRVDNWNDETQPFVKLARIALYVAIPVAVALGG